MDPGVAWPTTAASAPVAQLWNMHMGACVFTIIVFLPLPCLWWSPKKMTDDKLLEKFNEVVNWAKANLDLLRIREGDCFRSKLRQLNGGEEKRFCLLYTSPSPRDATLSRMPSSA